MKDLNNVEEKDVSTKSIFIVVTVVLISALSIIIPLFSAKEEAPNIREKIELEDTTISIQYPKNESYVLKTLEDTNQKESDKGSKVELSQESGDFIIDITVNKTTLKNEYMGNFKKYKEIKTSGLESQDITTNEGKTGFGYYNNNYDEYQVIFQGNNTETIIFTIKPMIKDKGEDAKTIFNRQNIQEIIKSVKI